MVVSNHLIFAWSDILQSHHTRLISHFVPWINSIYTGRKFSKFICPERFFMKMVFHRRSCTLLLNIIVEMKPFFKIGGSILFSALLIKRTSVIVLSLNFRTLFFWKKSIEWEFQDWNIILIAVCSMIICPIALEFWTHTRLATIGPYKNGLLDCDLI